MCMLMLWSQIIYGHCTASISPNIVRFYGARTAPGRRHEESCDFFYQFLDILRCPVMLRFYFKFHGARTAFGRVNEGKMTSAGHRTVSGRCTAGVCTHRTGTRRFLFKIYAWPGIAQCLTSAGNFKKSLYKSADARQGTGRCPYGHRPMFCESNCHRWEATCFAEEHIAFT